MSTQITEDLESVSINSMCIKIEEPSREDYFRHENYKCSCSLNPLSMKKHVPCVILHFLEKQAILNKFQTIMEQNKCLQLEKSQLKSENNQLKSANDLTLNNIGHIQEENDHLHSKVSKLTNELEIKKTIFFSKEKRLFKIIEQLEEHISSLESKLSKQTTLVSTIKSNVSKISVLDLNDSINKQIEKIENRIESFKSKSLDTFNDGKMKQSSGVSIPKVEMNNVSQNNKVFQNSSSSNKPKVVVPKKIYSCKSSKPFVKKVSQFTTYSLQKAKKYLEKQYSSGTFTSSSFLSFSDNSSFISNAFSQMKNHEWKQKQKVSSNSTPTKSFKYSLSKLFDLAPRTIRSDEQKVNDFVLKNPPTFKTPSSFKSTMKTNDFSPLRPQKLFQNETPCFKSKWDVTSIHQIDETYIWFSKVSKTVGPVLKWVPKVISK